MIAFVDTDVIVRLIAGDDPRKKREAIALFERVERGELELTTPVTTFADCVYVLCSPRLYSLPRTVVVSSLLTLVRLRHFRIANRNSLVSALELFATTNLDFGDALIAATMLESGSRIVYSYDEDFDRMEGIERRQP